MSRPIDRIKEIADTAGITLTEMERVIGASKGVLTRAASKGTNLQLRWLQVIAEKFPEWDSDWIITGKDRDSLTPEKSYIEGTPYYDVDFECGFDELFAPSSENPEYLIKMPGYEKATLWCNASGHSMEPEISNGDIIALKRIEDFTFLPYGDVYGIITKNGLRTIKRLGRASREGYYRLIPTNKNYDEQEIPVSIISAVYRVMGAMKAF